MRERRRFLLVVIAGLAARLAHLIAIRRHPYYDLCEVWRESDMYQYLVWARHLAAGDWLDASTFRPFFAWQAPIAPREVWESWFGAHVYYQPPLYPYLLAVVLALGGTADWFRAGQLALGALSCGLIALLARRLHGSAAGLVAGLAAAVYAPFLVYDAEVLRGTVVIATQLALLLALLRAGGRAGASLDAGRGAPRGAAAAASSVAPRVARPAHAAWRGIPWAMLAGGGFGLSYLADPGVALFAPLALGWLVWSSRASAPADPRAGSARAALFAAGAAAALIPLAARNLAVGAPALSLTTRGPLAFVMGNAPDARPAGAVLPDSTRAILSASGYRMGDTIVETLRQYRGDVGSLAGKQWEKMKALWGAYEVPDNPSFYYAARVSPAARWGLRFPPVAALGLVGLVPALAASRRRPEQALMALFLIACTGLFLLAHVVSRYRQPMVAPLLVSGAGALAWAAGRWREGGARARLQACAVPGAAAALLAVLPAQPPPGYGYVRPAEHVLVAGLYSERGQHDLAVTEMSDLISAARSDPDLGGGLPPLWFRLGTIQVKAGRLRDALESFQQAQRLAPDYVEAERAAQEVRAALAAEEAPP